MVELSAKIVVDGCQGLLIRSGDGDLFGQTAAHVPALADCWVRRHVAVHEAGSGLIIAAVSRRQRHNFAERGR
jgi:hypothetical protein